MFSSHGGWTVAGTSPYDHGSDADTDAGMAGRKVSIPAGTTAIDDDEFAKQTDITSVIFPDSLRVIGPGAFRGCTGLLRVDLHRTRVTVMHKRAFCGCTALAEVLLPSTLVKLEAYAFSRCTMLASVDLSGTKVSAIVDSTFGCCVNLTTITFPATLTTIGGGNFALGAFRGCTKLTGFALPSRLETIGADAFEGCSSLAELRIPGSVLTVASYAFSRCTALHTVVVESSTLRFETSEGYGAAGHFYDCAALAAISVPDTAATAAWPNSMFTGTNPCTLPLAALLAAATPRMQLQFYWKPGRDARTLCSSRAREAVCTVLLVATRWTHRWEALSLPVAARRSSHVQAARVRLALADLPDELWFYILGLIRRHELGLPMRGWRCSMALRPLAQHTHSLC